MYYPTQRPDQTRMDERTAAINWLLEDPTHRAIHSPTELDAILNMYAAQTQHPETTFNHDQFPPYNTHSHQPPAVTTRDTMELGQHNWTM